VLGTGFLLLVSLLLSAVIAATGKYLDGTIGATQLWELANFLLSIATITLLFAMIFRFLPDVNIAWGDVWLGAFVTAVLFTLGKFGIGLYLGKSSLTSVYGAAGSLVLILAWVYYSSLILFLGAEFTRAYAAHYGSLITPATDAEPLVSPIRPERGLEPDVKRPPAA
jgi:membrane protein